MSRVHAFILLCILSLSGCKTNGSLTSTKGLQSTQTPKQGKNIAVFIGDSGDGKTAPFLKGVAKDQEIFSDLFSDLNFEKVEFYNKSKSEILSQLAKIGNEVGEDGTLLIFFSAHGMEGSGNWWLRGEMLSFNELVFSIFDGRSYKALQRLVIVNNACFSGEVAQSASLNQFRRSYNLQLYAKQMIFFGASHSYRAAVSYDDYGGFLTIALAKTIHEAKVENWTVRQWFNKSVEEINKIDGDPYPKQYPEFAAYPASVLDEPLFSDAPIATNKALSGTGSCPQSYGKSWSSKFSRDQNNCPNQNEVCLCWPATVKGTFWDSHFCSIYPPNAKPDSEAIFSQKLQEGEVCDRLKCQSLYMSDYQRGKSNCQNKLIYINSDGLLDLTVAVPGTSL